MTIWKRTGIGAVCLWILALSGFLWWDSSLMGFPDGHLTELERARYPFYRIFSVIHLIWFPVLVSRMWTADQARTRRILTAYGVFTAIFFFSNWCMAQFLDNGIGG
jgi:hypothetical protein